MYVAQASVNGAMKMDLPRLLMWGVVGWTALGTIGITLSLVRGRLGVQGEQQRLWRGLRWIAGVWIVYLCALLAVSLAQPQRMMTIGQEQCFDKICFAVAKTEVVPSLSLHDQNKLIRVSIQIRNKGHKTSNISQMQAYLVDGQGRRWQESTGLSGVRLTATVPEGSSVVSEPIFQVAADATNLGLVFTRGHRQPGILVIGDSDSLLHRRTTVQLEPQSSPPGKNVAY